MRVLVCGGREYTDERLFLEEMNTHRNHFTHPADPCGKSAKCYMEIISGMAPGADTLAARYARAFGLKLHEFPADWKTHGKAAGPIRNQRMLDEGKPQMVVAFPGGSGTADMVRRAKKAGVFVIEVQPKAMEEV